MHRDRDRVFAVCGPSGRGAENRPDPRSPVLRRPATFTVMEKTRIEVKLPAALVAEARAFVARGGPGDLDDLLAEALRRFLESHAVELTEAFQKEDVAWGLRGDG